MVYCAQCEGKKSSGYTVTELNPSGSESESFAKIANSGASGLVWGTGQHTFYAVYPSTASITASGEDITISGSIPATQSFGTVTGTDAQVVPPVMANLYMTSKTTVDAGQTAGGDAFLSFRTISTVLEFTITNGFEDTKSDMKVSSISLTSENFKLSGDFSVLMNQDGLYERQKTSLGATTGNKVTIDFGGSPVTVAYGKTLNFTFFLNPGNASEVNDLTFAISGENCYDGSGFTRSAKLEDKSGTGVTFSTHKKTNIKGILVPESVGWEIEGEVSVVPWNEADAKDIILNR